ncbi:MAG TPA: IPT/TIG domain-containing protein [Candidatus Methanoperedens sp.]|nr:IPT/TIG domain-containing protein [Candidatus Methanoperedens sp.]HLB71754.1 IPT/TIG domain-containing protein [Candidatus Methanoperedens sp.]
MNRRYFFILGIGFVFLMQTLVFALIPPPPVNQNMGVYDTLFANLTENNCRGCHASGVPDTHHLLVPAGRYSCTNCHPVLPDGSGITLIRDCIKCHDTTFNGMTIRRPHHETQAALDRHCKTCHGSVVDDYDDGHYIPTYPPSNMTPDTKFKVVNQTSGRKWGGCESCHEQDLTASPFIASNNKTHHRLGNLSGFRNNDNTKCTICHDLHNATYGSDSIRYCERCHSYNSLHNIQWDIANTTTTGGYGHLGPNDCQGCHAWYVAGSLAPGADLIVPSIGSLSTNNVLEGQATAVTIYGDDFVTTVDGVTRSSVVVVAKGTNIVTITPTSISHYKIDVTIPALNKGLYSIYALKDGNMESNRRPLVSAPNMIISSARKVNSTTVTITGSGFGTYDPAYKDFVNVTINEGSAIRSIQITSWSDTLINVMSTDAMTGDTATVNSVYGTGSAQVTN